MSVNDSKLNKALAYCESFRIKTKDGVDRFSSVKASAVYHQLHNRKKKVWFENKILFSEQEDINFTSVREGLYIADKTQRDDTGKGIKEADPSLYSRFMIEAEIEEEQRRKEGKKVYSEKEFIAIHKELAKWSR